MNATRTVQVSTWVGAPLVLAVLLLGFLFGRLTAGHDSADEASKVQTGVVGVVDSDGTVCIAETGDCYLVPGAGLSVGTKIHYRVEKVAIDPTDPAAGKRPVLVWVSTE